MNHINNYTSQNDYNELCFKDEMSEATLKRLLKEPKLNEDIQVHHVKNSTIYHCGFQDQYIFHIPKNGIVKTCYLHVKYRNLTDHTLQAFLLSEITLNIDDTLIIQTNMIINLLFAKILKIDIIEESDVIIFPIIIMSMCRNKFDVSKNSSAYIAIRIIHDIGTIEHMAFNTSTCDLEKNNTIITTLQKNNTIVTTQYRLYYSDMSTDFAGRINYIIFTEDIYDLIRRKSHKYETMSELTTDICVEEVTVLINNITEIKFKESEIMKLNIMGKMYYGLPLCSELKDKSGIKKFLKGCYSTSSIQKRGYTNLNNIQVCITSNRHYDTFYELYGIGFQ